MTICSSFTRVKRKGGWGGDSMWSRMYFFFLLCTRTCTICRQFEVSLIHRSDSLPSDLQLLVQNFIFRPRYVTRFITCFIVRCDRRSPDSSSVKLARDCRRMAFDPDKYFQRASAPRIAKAWHCRKKKTTCQKKNVNKSTLTSSLPLCPNYKVLYWVIPLCEIPLIYFLPP